MCWLPRSRERPRRSCGVAPAKVEHGLKSTANDPTAPARNPSGSCYHLSTTRAEIGRVRDHKALVENQLPKARDALAAKRFKDALNLLDGLSFSRRTQVQANHIRRQALVALSAQYRSEIETAIDARERTGVTLESVRVAVEFLRRHEDAAPDNRFMVARFDFIEAMGVARAHLEAGNVEEAIATAQGA